MIYNILENYTYMYFTLRNIDFQNKTFEKYKNEQ